MTVRYMWSTLRWSIYRSRTFGAWFVHPPLKLRGVEQFREFSTFEAAHAYYLSRVTA